jgi:tRNA pseudouridine55 synthase
MLVVDKPSGCTSHDVVDQVRRRLHLRRVGHAGTLDPDATGVLVIGVGRSTRLLRFPALAKKRYVGCIRLGRTTSTLDASGVVTGTYPMDGIDAAFAQPAADRLTGTLWQRPPMVSAVHHDGKRLHELARAGLEVEREPRCVEVTEFRLFDTGRPGALGALVECSTGTYVRVLAADLGSELGGGAHLGALRRIAVGSFTDAEAVVPSAVEASVLRPPSELVRDLASCVVGDAVARSVRFGAKLDRSAVQGAHGAGPWAVRDEAGELLAVYGVEPPSAARGAEAIGRDPERVEEGDRSASEGAAARLVPLVVTGAP